MKQETDCNALAGMPVTATVTPIRGGDGCYLIDAIVMVPVRYSIAVSAPTPEGACGLATTEVRRFGHHAQPDWRFASEPVITRISETVDGAPQPVTVPRGFGIGETPALQAHRNEVFQS